MSAAHTPEWVLGYPAGGVTGPTASPLVWWDGTEVKSQIITKGDEVVAIVARNGGLTDEQHDHARLIAAAPALFDAADNALNTLIGCCVPAGGVDDRKAILDAQAMLRAAIAAATGEAAS